MRRAASALLLLAACGGSGSDAKARCRDAIAKIDDVPEGERAVALAHACADAETGACRDRMRHLEDVPPEARADQLRQVCGVDASRMYAAAATSEPASGTLTLHSDGVDLAWNGMTLHLAKDCGAIGAALDTSKPDSLKLVADSAMLYAEVVSMMDCVKMHVTRIQLVTAP
jgi:hypothetical protein